MQTRSQKKQKKKKKKKIMHFHHKLFVVFFALKYFWECECVNNLVLCPQNVVSQSTAIHTARLSGRVSLHEIVNTLKVKKSQG